ncbi:MAG: DUF58 domain-containing protein [Odoribacter sp.]|nr:DUF58 domain-containing protein [Odoribacter sp.]
MRDLYLNRRFFFMLGGGFCALVAAFLFPGLYPWVVWGLCMCGALVVADAALLYGFGQRVEAWRSMQERFSNGEENTVEIEVENRYPFAVKMRVLDELPVEFQIRNLVMGGHLLAGETLREHYALHPVRRGVYRFGQIRVFVRTWFSLIERRYSFGKGQEIAVWPSFMAMRRYEALALTGTLQGQGLKKRRVAGVASSFDQIKPYVRGDDPRTVNWKATAKCNRLMINTYTEEHSQPIYCIIDKGRTMQAPFRGMTTLDYAINATLALSHIILKKGDCPGLVTFADKPDTWLKADNRRTQLGQVAEALYHQQTHFLESDFDRLCVVLSRRLTTRSLLVLFTNFDTVAGMKRRLPALKRLAENHLLFVVFFENTEIKEAVAQPARSVRDIYFKALGGSFITEKRQIVLELERFGIHALLTEPENLTVRTIESYLMMKARGLV